MRNVEEFKTFALRGNMIELAVGSPSVPPSPASPNPSSTTSSCRRRTAHRKKCPFCRTIIAHQATRCPLCTSQLEDAAAE